MKHIKKEELYFKRDCLSDELFDYDSIFFDIETTGFSPTNSMVYLIGCARRVEDKLVIDQFFADNKDDEIWILKDFLALLQKYHTIISFNGVGFDIPFLKAKCITYELDEDFKDYQYLDIFKSVSELKFLLKLENYKQKTIENFLEIHRDDKYSGGELINVYQNYLKRPDTFQRELLLLHNYDDVMGMTMLLPALSYLEVFCGQYAIKETQVKTYTTLEGNTEKELLITLSNDFAVPQRVTYQYKDFYLVMNQNVTTLRIPIFCGELKFFYTNYKEYYYLPEEDVAMHKSVATFVDKQFRENAKASNCYTRKQSEYIPQYKTVMNPEFKKEYKDEVSYFELNEDFYSSDVMLRRYVAHILNLMRKGKK